MDASTHFCELWCLLCERGLLLLPSPLSQQQCSQGGDGGGGDGSGDCGDGGVTAAAGL